MTTNRMKLRLAKRLSILFLLTTTAFNLPAQDQKTNSPYTVTFLKQQLEISVEIAASEPQRELGLMYRTHLGGKQGMLFVYPDQVPRQVWMKNTLLPLDVLFLSDEGYIVSILANLQPCTNNPCPIYDSESPAMYMLEVNSGFVNKNRIKIGQMLRLPSAKDTGFYRLDFTPAH